MSRHSRRAKRARSRDAGFSFVELLVTIIIAGIAFAAMVPVFVQAQQVTAGDKARSVALQVAQDRIEKLRQLDFELITTDNLNNNSYFIGDSPNTWTEQTEGGGTKSFNIAYTVTDKPVSATDARIAYKVVTVRVGWDGPPLPHKDVVLTTMIYRQYSGPTLVDFAISDANLELSDPSDFSSEQLIVNSPVTMQAVVNAADLDSMRPRTVGLGTRTGRVDFSVTSSTGTAYPTISVPFTSGNVFSAQWTVPGLVGAGDGYYTFKAVAYTAIGSPGNTWQLIYRIETGPPAPPTDLAGTAALTSANLTWNASTTGDVERYVVVRDGAEIATLDKAAGSMGYTDHALTDPEGTTYHYEVYAVDWLGNRSTAAAIDLTSIDPATTIAPLPASDLQGEAIDSAARLTWVASTTPGVLGYQVYQTIGGQTNTFTTATATLTVPQGWSTTALYQVKPFVAGGVLATHYAGLLTGQQGQPVDGVNWLRVSIGAEARYSLVITNSTNKDLTSLRLYYLGAAGGDPQQEITPHATSVPKGGTHTWSNLAAGRYRWDWVTSNNKTGQQWAWCTGATLTIHGSTP
ncbi:MAG: prepilin-type N-terminal cleavage/methylation domain-containing protein [Acidobacteriota bacterium]|nr:prepilin-type N-terminal cleavage/methylation domain-containing protein [Acidobacteriota bacterium]